MSQTTHPYGYVKDGKVYLKGYLDFPDRIIGEIKDSEESAIKYFEDRFQIAERKVNELETAVEDTENKGSYLMKLIHLKEYLGKFDGLGDFVVLFEKLDKVEEYLRDLISKNRVKNREIKRALLEEAKEILTGENWNENQEKFDDLKLRWMKTGNVVDDEQEEIEGAFRNFVEEFHEAKKEFYLEKKRIVNKRVYKYRDLIEEAKFLSRMNDATEAMERMKDVRERWKEVGSIPQAKIAGLWKHFKAINDNIYRKMKRQQSGDFSSYDDRGGGGSYGDRDRRSSYGDRGGGGGYGDRRGGGGYGDRRGGGGYGDRRGGGGGYGDRRGGGGYGDRRGGGGYGDRRGGGGYGDRSSGGSYGDRRSSYGDRSSGGGSYGDRDRRSSYGDRSSSGGSYGDRRSSYGARSSGSSYGDRDRRSSYGDRSGGGSYGDRDRRSSYGDRGGGSSYGDRDRRSSYGDRGGGSSYGDRDRRSSYGDRGGGGSYGSSGGYGDDRYEDPIENLRQKQNLVVQVEQLVGQWDDETMNQLKRLQANWKRIGRVPKESYREVTEAFNLGCDRIQERYYLEKLARGKCKEAAERGDHDFIYCKVKLLRDLTTRNEGELASIEQNLKNLNESGEENQVTKLVANKLVAQSRKLQVKRELMEELEAAMGEKGS